ncbi:MAG: tetratricopeptide repeat protein [Planctomycetes bacterium]|nr:tetratricopeptide repeat protein [Planctomycetota bacterium]
MRNNTASLLKKEGSPFEMPKGIFWSLWLLVTWYYTISKVVCWDLWWHMACGRFMLENGFLYPPTGTFTFAPVNPTTPNSLVWVGDILLHVIHEYLGGIYGLQAFRLLMILCPILCMLSFAKWRYNVYTLFIACFLVVSTMQQHLIKNAIFAMFFLPFLIWLWHQIRTGRFSQWCFLLFPFVSWIWTKMHGYCLVWAYVMGFVCIGELIDQIKERKGFNFRFVALLLLSTIATWGVIDDSYPTNWRANLHHFHEGVVKSVASLFTTEKKGGGVEVASAKAAGGAVSEESFRQKFTKFKDKQKQMFRVFVKGGDEDVIAEYQSPYDIPFVLSVRALYFLTAAFVVYALVSLILFWRSTRFSYLLPAVISVYLGSAYLRSVAFPSLIAMPLMVLGIASLEEEERKRVMVWGKRLIGAVPLALLSIYFLSVIYFNNDLLGWTLICLQWLLVCVAEVFGRGGTSVQKYLTEASQQVNQWTAANTAGIAFAFSAAILLILAALLLLGLLGHRRAAGETEEGETFSEGMIARFFRGPAGLVTGVVLILLATASAGYYLWDRPVPGHFLDQPWIFLQAFSVPFMILLVACVLPVGTLRRFAYPFAHPLMAITLFVMLFQFLIFEHYYAFATGKQFHKVTGFIGNEPGLGRTNLYEDAVPNWILKNIPPSEKVYNSYNVGGFLVFSYYTDRKVFIDGRSVMFTPDFYNDYKDNMAYKYINYFKTRVGVLSIIVDRPRVLGYLKHNWTPIVFDTSMVVLQRPLGKDASCSYGMIPEFIGKSEKIKDLTVLDQMSLAQFLDDSLLGMLLFGRIKDAKEYYTKYADLFNNKVGNIGNQVQVKLNVINDIERRFGLVNDPILGELCQKLNQKPDSTQIHLAFGEALRKFGKNPVLAGHEYMAALNSNPKDNNLRIQVANVLMTMKFFSDAVKLFEEALKISPNDPKVLNNMGHALCELGQFDKGRDVFLQAMKVAPDIEEPVLNLSAAYRKQGKNAEAVELLQKFVEGHPGAQRSKALLEEIRATATPAP